KRLLRNVHLPNAFHSPLSLFLFLQQLAFARNIPAITLGQNVFPDGGNRFPRNHAMADGRLDGDLKHLARDKFFHLFRKSLAVRVRGITMNDPGKSVDRFTADQDVQLDKVRSEEHTSELQSRFDLVCRLLLEKK